MRRYVLQETKYGTPAVSASGLQLLSEKKKKKNLEDSVTKVKRDNAGHMHTNRPYIPADAYS